ncbi:MAG: ABC transporter ATP-binding protein [Rhodospirillaceae bacterium]|nr:MAG: ABC transporter ATP-binding protein [Rhodospirillaceae bacterium]
MQSTNTPSDSSLGNVYRVLRKHGIWRQIPIVTGLLVTGVLDGISLTTLLPMISMLTGNVDGKTGPLQRYIQEIFQALHLPLNLGFLCSVVIGCLVVKAVITLQINKYVNVVVAEICRELRQTLISRLLEARWSYFTVNPVGRFVATMIPEANWAGYAYRAALNVSMQVVRAIILALVALIFGWRTAAVAVALGLLMGLALRFLTRTSRTAAKAFRTSLSGLVADLTDLIIGYKPLKAMGRESILIARLRSETKAIRRSMYDLVMMQQLSGALPDFLIGCTLAFGIYVVNLFFGITIEPLLAFGIATYGLMNSVSKIQKSMQELAQSDNMYWAVQATIAEVEEAGEPHRGTAKPALTQDCRLENVSFSYGRGAVLNDVSIEIPAGGITTLIGESGSGKTTVADLLLGLFLPESGRILIDGVDLKEIDIRQWRSMIGYVPQEVLMFNDTILANIALGDPSITEVEVIEALKVAGVYDFIMSLPGGLQTLVGERGMMISGGQRQRIALARALVHRPQLLILDEATSALDPQTEAEICAAVRRQAGQITVLAITHQPSWVDAADRIYLIDRGRAHLRDRRADGGSDERFRTNVSRPA